MIVFFEVSSSSLCTAQGYVVNAKIPMKRKLTLPCEDKNNYIFCRAVTENAKDKLTRRYK